MADKDIFAFPQLSHSAPSGMTLRDYFAAKAMEAGYGWLMRQPKDKLPEGKSLFDLMPRLAESSYKMADAMLIAREKQD